MRTFKIHPSANQSAECLKKAEERPPSEGAPGSDSYGRDRWGKLDKAIGLDVVDIKVNIKKTGRVFSSRDPATLSATARVVPSNCLQN
jgi:hypothetical protein